MMTLCTITLAGHMACVPVRDCREAVELVKGVALTEFRCEADPSRRPEDGVMPPIADRRAEIAGR